jgi:two-component system invasion response regulator UvrY
VTVTVTAPRILLADDHEIVRKGLRQMLAEAFPGAVFGEASDAAEAVRKVRESDWDAAVLDISLPDRSGLEVLSEIRKMRPKLPIVVLSMYDEEQFAVRAMRAGAAGYVTKRKAAGEIVAAVKKALAGGRYLTPSLAAKLGGEIGLDAAQVPHQRLSNREFEVFLLLASGRTVKSIAEQLHVSVQTVSTHRTRLLEKMKMKTNADLTGYAVLERLL